MKNIIVIFCLLSFSSLAQLSQEARDSINYAIDLLNIEGNYNEGDRLLFKYKDSIKSDTNKIKFYIVVAGIKGSLGKQNDAISYANDAMVLSQKNQDFYKLEIVNLLGFIHGLLGDEEKAISYWKESIRYEKVSFVILSNYEYIVQGYIKLNNIDSALVYANLAINQFSKESILDSISETVLYKINVLKERCESQDPNETILLLKDGIEKGILEENATNNANIAGAYYDLKQYDSSVVYYNKAVNWSVLKEDTLRVVEMYQKLIDIYKELGSQVELEKTILLTYNYNSYLQEVDQAKYRELVLMYNQASAKPSRNNYFLIFGIISFIGIMIFVVYRFQKNKKPKVTKTTEAKTQILISNPVIEKIEIGLKKMVADGDYLKPDFNMSFLENKLGVNRKYIGVYFKNERQISLTSYTNILRIKYAEKRLTDHNDNYGKYTIEEMALEAGYKTPHTFKKYFSQYSSTPLKSEKKDC